MLLEEDKRGILLESGTNEIEVMEFTINESRRSEEHTSELQSHAY